MKCDDCFYANKSMSDGYVMCRWWQSRFEENKEYDSIEQFVKQVVFGLTNLDDVGIGFGNRKKHNKLESHWSYKGTVSESILTNDQILTKKEDKCSMFKLIKKESE